LLGKDIGFEMIDAGKINIARLLEPVAMLWIRLAFTTRLGRDFAFKLLRCERARSSAGFRNSVAVATTWPGRVARARTSRNFSVKASKTRPQF